MKSNSCFLCNAIWACSKGEKSFMVRPNSFSKLNLYGLIIGIESEKSGDGCFVLRLMDDWGKETNHCIPEYAGGSYRYSRAKIVSGRSQV